ncbi:MAG: dipeptide epimerase [Rhodothalassiaceae bacterium]
MGRRRLTVWAEAWPLARPFAIARGSVTQVTLFQAALTQAGRTGRGEARLYPRYGDSVAAFFAQAEDVRTALEAGAGRKDLLTRLPAGGPRAALDAALWDLEAQLTGEPVWQRLGLSLPDALPTAFTVSLATPTAMAEAAGHAPGRVLKLKLGQSPRTDLECIAAVAEARPDAQLILDANEGWDRDMLSRVRALNAPICLIEQPLPAGSDRDLPADPRLCADESLSGEAALAALPSGYGAINVKLDKAGGLTAALDWVQTAQTRGLAVFLGCHVATSLAMMPALMLAPFCQWIDLDGAWLLARDRQPGLRYANGCLQPAPGLWGAPRPF